MKKQCVSPPDKWQLLSCNTLQQRWEFWQQSAQTYVVTTPQSERHCKCYPYCSVLPETQCQKILIVRTMEICRVRLFELSLC